MKTCWVEYNGCPSPVSCSAIHGHSDLSDSLVRMCNHPRMKFAAQLVCHNYCTLVLNTNANNIPRTGYMNWELIPGKWTDSNSECFSSKICSFSII